MKFTVTSFHQSNQHHLSLQFAANYLCSCSSFSLIIILHYCSWISGQSLLINLCSRSLINAHVKYNLSSIPLCKHCQCHQPVTIIIFDCCHCHMNGCHYLVKLSHKDVVPAVRLIWDWCTLFPSKYRPFTGLEMTDRQPGLNGSL